MMKRILTTTAILLGAGLNQAAYSATGSFFNVAANGATLTIKTTVPNHTYSAAGIKINTPGFTFASTNPGCMMAANGYCLFSCSDTTAANIIAAGASGNMDFTLCLNGAGALSCQNYARSVNTQMSLATVGYYRNTSAGNAPLSYTSANGGSAWGLSSALPLPADVLTNGPDTELQGITCDNAGLQCSAVGYYRRGTGANNATANGYAPLSYTSANGGSTWSLSSTLPLPADVATGSSASTLLQGVG